MLTGAPGVGKTTLVKAAADAWAESGRATTGFLTVEARDGRGRRLSYRRGLCLRGWPLQR